MAQWLSWLERRPVTAEVTGSSPVWVVESMPMLTLGQSKIMMRIDKQACPAIRILS